MIAHIASSLALALIATSSPVSLNGTYALQSGRSQTKAHLVATQIGASALDERLHRCVNDASRNRFIKGFYDMISMIFHYHYQWNKKDEKERNIAAIHEHLCYIGALQNRAGSAITATCNAHMATARSTLLASIRRSADALRMPACS